MELHNFLSRKSPKNRLAIKIEFTDNNLSNYINGHKTFEVGHKEGLIKAIEPYIDKTESRGFAVGYLSVCFEMTRWWNELADSVNIYEEKP